MGGNGARSAFLADTLDEYQGVRFKQVGCVDNVKVIMVSTQTNTAVPMESFTSSMYYVENPKIPGRISHITFYDKKGGIKVAIDMVYDKQGKYVPYQTYQKNGRAKSRGSHMHRFNIDDNGDYGRKSHDQKNCLPFNAYYMRFVNKALIYNSKQ